MSLAVRGGYPFTGDPDTFDEAIALVWFADAEAPEAELRELEVEVLATKAGAILAEDRGSTPPTTEGSRFAGRSPRTSRSIWGSPSYGAPH